MGNITKLKLDYDNGQKKYYSFDDGQLIENFTGTAEVYCSYGDVECKCCEGKFMNGRLNGKASMYDIYGKKVFEGEYFDDDRNGKGKYCFIDGTEIECEYKNDKLISDGIVYKVDKNGNRVRTDKILKLDDLDKWLKSSDKKLFYIDGNFVNEDALLNKKSFEGECYDLDGGVAIGRFNEYGELIYGKETSASGTIREGLFENGVLKEGRIAFTDGSVYDGTFHNNKCTGNMTQYWNGQLVLKGECRDNKLNGKGEKHNRQGVFDGKFEDDIIISGTFSSNESHGKKPIYTVKTENGEKVVKYYLNEQNTTDSNPDITAVIKKNNILSWKSGVTEEIENKAETILGSFDKNESYAYNCLLANLASINNNYNVVQYSNSFDCGQKNAFKVQLDDFINFARKPENENKVITSELYTNSHAIGIIYKGDKIIIVDTSGGCVNDKEASQVLCDLKRQNNENFAILAQGIQSTGNCVLTSRAITNELAKDIVNKNLEMDKLIEYSVNKARYDEADNRLVQICRNKENFIYPRENAIKDGEFYTLERQFFSKQINDALEDFNDNKAVSAEETEIVV
ncbi:MAG: hypothetical protein IJ853_04210 [Rickettsiales bacterium]|nr:hypothetical protein [Rickettsiales bacterium]